MAYTQVVLTYIANVTGPVVASTLATKMAAAATAFWTAAKQAFYGATFVGAVGTTPDVYHAQVVVTLTLTATFEGRFPSVFATLGAQNGPFPSLMGPPIAAAILQPVLTQAPAYT